MTIILEVTSKLPGRKESKRLEVAIGMTVAELLSELDITDDREEILVVYNGKSACLGDDLRESGAVLLLPILCGG